MPWSFIVMDNEEEDDDFENSLDDDFDPNVLHVLSCLRDEARTRIQAHDHLFWLKQT